MYKLVALTGLMFAALTGCATLDKEECTKADWRAIGEADGRDGRASDRLHRHKDACSEYGISVNRGEYMRGWNAGIAEYCTLSNGYALGSHLHAYQQICPVHLEGNFAHGYREGAEAVLRELRWQYDANEQEFKRYTALLSHARGKDERAKYAKEVEDHEAQHEKLEKEISRVMRLISVVYGRQLELSKNTQ